MAARFGELHVLICRERRNFCDLLGDLWCIRVLVVCLSISWKCEHFVVPAEDLLTVLAAVSLSWILWVLCLAYGWVSWKLH